MIYYNQLVEHRLLVMRSRATTMYKVCTSGNVMPFLLRLVVQTATAEWGDNLAGDAKLKVGQPIRVELGLFDDTGVTNAGL